MTWENPWTEFGSKWKFQSWAKAITYSEITLENRCKVHSVTFYSCGSITIWQTAHWNIKSLRPDGKKWLSEGDNG